MGGLLVMVQREVGERMAAGAGEHAYGAVSVKIAYFAQASWSAGSRPRSSPGPASSQCSCGWPTPAPAVDPAVVPYRRFEAVVRAGFGQRRKMLRRSLAGMVTPEAFERAGVGPEARAEELGVADWGRLAARDDALP